MKQARVWHLVRQYVRRHGPLSGVDSMSTRLLCLEVVHFFDKIPVTFVHFLTAHAVYCRGISINFYRTYGITFWLGSLV